MSRLATTSEFSVVAGEIRRTEVMDIVRGVVFIGALLLAWISLTPFEDLSDMRVGDVTLGSNATTYAIYGLLAALTLVIVLRDNAAGLATLASPSFLMSSTSLAKSTSSTCMALPFTTFDRTTLVL